MKYLVYLGLCLALTSCQSENQSSSQATQTDKHSDLYSWDIAHLKENPARCKTDSSEINWPALNEDACNWLSDYNLFSGVPSNTSNIHSPGVAYQLNSALFTDHAHKYRYVILPNSEAALFDSQNAFEFPVGSVLIKVFALPLDRIDNDQDQIVEVRLQIKREQGWILLPYIWHPQSNDAYLHLSGKNINHSYQLKNETISFEYRIPSAGTCQICHQQDSQSVPIGLKARHLNRAINHQGQSVNQLLLWQSLGLVKNLPVDLDEIDTVPNWLDSSYSLEDRAKAYLDINCAHCHSDDGSAALSGLRLEYWRKTVDYHHGVCNSSHGWRGGGFDIWPGEGEASSIPRRMNMIEAKDRMPPIGRSLIDDSAVILMQDWINSLPYEDCGR